MTISLRQARPEDAEELIVLIGDLGHQLALTDLGNNLARLNDEKLPQLVAEKDGRIAGLLGMDCMYPVYRSRPVARITILVVAEEVRGCGVGKTLVEHSVGVAREWGCEMIEVTSNDRLTDAHAFYLHLGFSQTSRRFALKVD